MRRISPISPFFKKSLLLFLFPSVSTPSLSWDISSIFYIISPLTPQGNRLIHLMVMKILGHRWPLTWARRTDPSGLKNTLTDSFTPVITEIFRRKLPTISPASQGPLGSSAHSTLGHIQTYDVSHSLINWAAMIFMKTKRNILPQEDMVYLSTWKYSELQGEEKLIIINLSSSSKNPIKSTWNKICQTWILWRPPNAFLSPDLPPNRQPCVTLFCFYKLVNQPISSHPPKSYHCTEDFWEICRTLWHKGVKFCFMFSLCQGIHLQSASHATGEP